MRGASVAPSRPNVSAPRPRLPGTLVAHPLSLEPDAAHDACSLLWRFRPSRVPRARYTRTRGTAVAWAVHGPSSRLHPHALVSRVPRACRCGAVMIAEAREFVLWHVRQRGHGDLSHVASRGLDLLFEARIDAMVAREYASESEGEVEDHNTQSFLPETAPAPDEMREIMFF